MRRVFLLAVLGLVGACSILPSSGKRFVVFFSESSSSLDNAAQSIVGAASDYARAHPDRAIVVSGFADPTGTPEANAAITRARVDAVAKGLQAGGVLPSQIGHQEVGVIEVG